jgi:hypothetical protein
MVGNNKCKVVWMTQVFKLFLNALRKITKVRRKDNRLVPRVPTSETGGVFPFVLHIARLE